MQDVLLALLAKEPAHGYELRSRLVEALGPLGEGLNPGQVYVTLRRLERAGLVAQRHHDETTSRADRKVYELTAAGRERVSTWLADVAWPKPTPTEFHLKLVAVASSKLADPVALIDAQRRELLRLLRGAQGAVLDEPGRSTPALLLEGTVLRLQADLRWLEACLQHWTSAPPDALHRG